MSEHRMILERARQQFPAPDIPLDGVLRRRDRRQRNRRIGTAVLALVLAAAAIGGLVRAFYPAEGLRPAEKTPRSAVERISVGSDTPRAQWWRMHAAAGEGGVWVTSWQADGRWALVRVDPATDEVVASIEGVGGSSVAVGEGAVWVASPGSGGPSPGDGLLFRLDPATNHVVARIRPEGGTCAPWAVAVGAGSVWATCHGTGALQRIDAATNATETISIPQPVVHDVAVLDGTVWVTAREAPDVGGSETLFGIDAASGALVATIPVFVPTDLAAGFGSLWAPIADRMREIATEDGGFAPLELGRIDPSSGSVIASVELRTQAGREPAMGVQLAIGEGAVWIGWTDREDGVESGTILRVDPQTNEVVGELTLAGPVTDLAAGAGAVWVADGRGTLYRIDPDAVTKSS